MPIESEGVEVILQKKQPPPTTPTQTGGAVTPPVQEPQFPETGDPNILVNAQFSQRTVNMATGEINIPPESITAPTPTVKFWLDLGTPQYIGRYAPFDIPTGYKVSGMVERDNQLQISFMSTRPYVANPASLMKNLEAFAVQAQPDNPIYMSMTEWIESAFAGKPGLMKSLTDFTVEGQQNLWDLQAKEFAESDYGKFLESSPGAKRMYESAVRGGRPAPTFEFWTWTEKKPTLQEAYQQYHDIRMLDKPTLQEAYQQYHDVRMPELLIAESKTFYEGIGYSEFGGKYAPFTIPAGYRVQSIAQQGVNLAVTFEPVPVTPTVLPKSSVGLALKALPWLTAIGQSITKPFFEEADILRYNAAHLPRAFDYPKTLPNYKPTLEEQRIQQERTDVAVFGLSSVALFVLPPLIPLKLAGSVAIGLAGRTLVASGIGGAVGYYYNPTLEGAGIGALLTGAIYLGSFAITRGLTYAAQKSLQSSYESSLQQGELWKPSTLQKLEMAVTGAKPKQLPPSVVGLPTLIEEGKTNLDLISYSELPSARAMKVGGDISIQTYKQLPSLIAGEELFGFTDVPRTMGYGLTVPTPELTQAAAASSMETFGLPYPALSSIVAKWFTPIEQIPKQELGFSKEPQTYRAAQTQYFNEAKGVLQDSTLSFSKQFGELPTKSGLLSQITEQEAKAIAVSRGMPNVFGPAVTTIQKTAAPLIVANLGEMTSWLLSQETRVKTMETAITPLSISFQQQPRTKQMDESQFLTFPGQVLTVNVPTRETTITPSILNLGASQIYTKGKQKEETIQSLSLLEKQVYQNKQQQKTAFADVLGLQSFDSVVAQKQKTVLFSGNIINTLSDISIKETTRVTPIVASIFRQDYVYRQQHVSPLPPPPKTTPVIPKLFDIPRHGSNLLGPRAPSNMLYPYGRQKRKYPVMTGQEAANFLYPQKRKKKHK